MTQPEPLLKKEEIARTMGLNGDWYVNQVADCRLSILDKLIIQRKLKVLQQWAQADKPLTRSTITLMEEIISSWKSSTFPEIKWSGEVLEWRWVNNIGAAELKIAAARDPELQKAMNFFAVKC
jgi:hypothetical protein